MPAKKAKLGMVAARSPIPEMKLAQLAKLLKTNLRGKLVNLTRYRRGDGNERFQFRDAQVTDFSPWTMPVSFNEVIFHRQLQFSEDVVRHWLTWLVEREYEVSIDASFPKSSGKLKSRPSGYLRLSFHLPNRLEKRTSPCYSLWFALKGIVSEAVCQQSLKIVESWNVDGCFQIERSEDPLGFSVEIADPRFLRSFSHPKKDEGAFPTSVNIEPFEDLDEALERFFAAVATWPSAPTFCDVRIHVPSTKLSSIQPKLLPWSSRCNYSFYGKYRKGFEPRRRPEAFPGNRTFRYPLLECSVELSDLLRLQVEAVHDPEASYLEYSSSQGLEKLKTYLEPLGLDCEYWTGPFEERWGSTREEPAVLPDIGAEIGPRLLGAEEATRAFVEAYSIKDCPVDPTCLGVHKMPGAEPGYIQFAFRTGPGRLPLPVGKYFEPTPIPPELAEGARSIVHGHIEMLDDQLRLIARMVDAQTGAYQGAVKVDGETTQKSLNNVMLRAINRLEPAMTY